MDWKRGKSCRERKGAVQERCRKGAGMVQEWCRNGVGSVLVSLGGFFALK